MLRFPRALPDRPLNPKEQLQREAQDLRFQRQEYRKKLTELKYGVAVVGGGFAGVMAAWELSQHGVKVTVYEAHNEVGGRVRSNSTWSEGRITEEGAELIGSFHTTWLGFARRYGLGVVSRMESDLYHRAGLDVKLTLDQPLSMTEFETLSAAMEKRILRPLALLALSIRDPSRPWRQPNLLKIYDGMSVQDALPKFCPIAKRTKGNKDERLWKMIEFKLVNDEVAPLDEMNFLGLLCKVRGGQGQRFGAGLKPILMGYWDELEIFRCADGCQELAKRMTTEISQKDGKIWPNTMVKVIDISKDDVRLTWVPVRNGTPDTGSGQVERFDYVVFAIPPSVWNAVTIRENEKKVDPTAEIGDIGMAPAVKFFSDVKERFWINKGAAPYGGSLKLGQVWEGTDNQTRVEVEKCLPKRRVKQGVVLSVFAGPLLPGPRVPTEQEFKDELKNLYSGQYDPTPNGNVRKTLLANWPEERFIKTGYVSPKINQLIDIGEKLDKPFHERLFFAGEHTQMDHFGYMEGALRSGARAADTLMLTACGLLEASAKGAGRSEPTATRKPSPQPVGRATPTREATAVERERGLALAAHSFRGPQGDAETPFLDRELLVADFAAEDFDPRAAALVAESPFAGALDERRSEFGEEPDKREALDEFEDAGKLDAERGWEEVEEKQDEDLGSDEDAPLREFAFGHEGVLTELEDEGPSYEPEAGETFVSDDETESWGAQSEWDEFDDERGRGERRHEWDAEAEDEDEQLVSELAYETMPEDAEAEGPLEEFQTGSPAGLALLEHMHVPKAPDPAHPGTFKTGGPTLLKSADMNPGWIDANDNLVTDKSGAGLQRCLELSITSDFQGLLSRRAQTAPTASDRIHVALVDLTGNKLAKPDFAGWGSTLAIFGASVPKVLPLYAAYQLRADLRDLISRRSPKDGRELEKFVIDEWKAKGLTTKQPDLVFLFDVRKWTPSDTLDFTAATRGTFANISKNCPPGQLIAKVGFPYIGSVAWQSGLFHPTRGGLWLTVAFCNQGSWASPVKSPHALNASALSAATYFSLLAQGRLVDDPSSGEIKDALKHGCVTSLLPPLPVVASKCGIASGHVHDCAWIEDADVRYVIAVMSRLSTNAHASLYTKLCKELDRLVRENNNPSRKLCI